MNSPRSFFKAVSLFRILGREGVSCQRLRGLYSLGLPDERLKDRKF